MALVAVLSCLAASMAAIGRERPSAFAPADAATTGIEIAGEPAHYETASSNGIVDVEVSTGCSETRPRGVDVALAWKLTRGGAEAVRVDLTEFGRGFANGDYVTSGVLEATEGSELFFAGADPGIYYYWRLLTRGPDGWAVAANGRFEAPVCPADSVRE